MSTIGKQQKNGIIILRQPRVTEKATDLSTRVKPVYVFEVSADATKQAISQAVKSQYKVEPIKVNIVRLPAKRVLVRGRRGIKSGVKKALVYLRSGDKIEIV